jgi:hypothetical protein
MNKKLLLILILFLVVVLVLVGFGFGWFKLIRKSEELQSHQIQGQLKEIMQNNKLLVSGFWVIDGTKKLANMGDIKDIIVELSPDTKFIKTIWHMPPLEEWNRVRSTLDLNSVKKEQLEGSVDDLKNVVGSVINVKTYNNAIFKPKVKASEVSYNIFLYGK